MDEAAPRVLEEGDLVAGALHPGPPTTPAPTPTPLGGRGRMSRAIAGLRVRLALWVVVLLAVMLLMTVVAIRTVLIGRLDARIDTELVQEAEELRGLADGNDPDTGQPFADRVDRIMEVFFRRNIPLRNEVMLGFAQGELIARDGERDLLDVVSGPDLMAAWQQVDATTRDRVQTSLGRLEYLAVPLSDESGVTVGTFVVAIFADIAREEVTHVVRVAGIVGALALLTASALAVGLAGRILGPVRALSETAQQINEQDLTRRITVEGRDELAQLGEVVNTMLDRLEDAFDSQRAFLDDTGHELRTPLTIIRGHLEVMGEDPEEVREVRSLVLDEVARMHRIVDDLILLAKAQRPDFLRTDRVDVHALTREVHAKAEALSADITWRLGSTADVVVAADRQRLTQALVQLAQNASVHCPTGTTVTIASSVGPDGVRLAVADDGPGVAGTDQPRLFDRFHRGRQSRVESSGTGLGLAIVRAIAEAHGGRVQLVSRTGQGSCFTIVLPATAEDLR